MRYTRRVVVALACAFRSSDVGTQRTDGYAALTSRFRPRNGQAGQGSTTPVVSALRPPQRHTAPVTREDG